MPRLARLTAVQELAYCRPLDQPDADIHAQDAGLGLGDPAHQGLHAEPPELAAIAAPDPDEEPHGLRSSICGFRTCPPMADQPETESSERKFAHCERLVLPKMPAP